MTEHEILGIIKDKYSAILGGKLLGIYVHGSIAFGCFDWERSDIDFLVVVTSPPGQSEKEQMITALLAMEEQAPPKGFEMSVVLAGVCRPFVYPTPYELHFSNSYLDGFRADLAAQCRSLHGVDRDLAAHITVTRAVGFPLCGPAVSGVFAPVPRADYIDSILYDIENAPDEIVRDPVYFTLNLCRVLAYLTDGLVLSKEQGGQWGIAHLPRHVPLIGSTLVAYNDGGGFREREDVLREFAENMLYMIKEKI